LLQYIHVRDRVGTFSSAIVHQLSAVVLSLMMNVLFIIINTVFILGYAAIAQMERPPLLLIRVFYYFFVLVRLGLFYWQVCFLDASPPSSLPHTLTYCLALSYFVRSLALFFYSFRVSSLFSFSFARALLYLTFQNISSDSPSEASAEWLQDICSLRVDVPPKLEVVAL
jgi:hypothetical protein